MKTADERSLGAGALAFLAAFFASVQQGLLWVACLFSGFLIHVLWFWRRVLLRTPSSSSSSTSRGEGGKQRRRGRKGSYSKRRGATADEKLPAASAAAAAPPGAAAAAAERDPSSGGAVRRRQQQEGACSRSSGSNSSSASSSSVQESEDSEGPQAVQPAAGHREGGLLEGDREGGDTMGGGDLWDAGLMDSADEADSEVEQDRLLPAAKQRQSLPRRMSFVSLNLAAGCFSPSSKVKHHVITSCMYTSKLPSTKTVLELIEHRLLKFHRFRSVPVLSHFYPRWREVSVQPASHVRRLRVADALELHLCTEWIMCEPCEPSRPRWQVWLVENAAARQKQQQQQDGEVAVEAWDSQRFRTEEERQEVSKRVGFSGPQRHCILVRAEHCIGDGVSLLEVGMRVLSDAKGVPLNEWKVPPILAACSAAATEHLCLLPSPTALLLRWTKVLLRAPRRLADAVYVGGLLLAGSLSTVASTLLSKLDACSPVTGPAEERLRRPWCPRARVALAPPIDLELAKEIRKAAGATLNDVFLAAFTGAFKRYCELRGDFQFSQPGNPLLPKLLLACAFFRRTRELPDDSQLLLRNRFTLTSLAIPADSSGAEETLRRIRRATAALKWSRQAAADFLCQKVLGQLLPLPLTQRAVESRFRSHSLVFSNLPAYTAPVYFCGSEVTEVQVFYPNLIPQVEVVSYAGRIFLSISYDPSVVAKGHLIPKLFVEELLELARALGLPAHAAKGGKQQKREGPVSYEPKTSCHSSASEDSPNRGSNPTQ